ncbi:MAG TPA: NAD-dependent epimerase/dehydratase family protein, partial [Lacipirellulaceae bacterium]|nr:NAD-dependent epimerase/dehydratase family protein [Lacipirellulaceae bacterium]
MGVCLVTGGAGFIGSHVATALVERGQRVRVLDNLISGHRSNLAHLRDRVEFVEGDLVNRPDVERALAGVEVIYHQAALASVPRSVERPLDTNAACVTGTVNLLDAARKAGVRRIVFA